MNNRLLGKWKGCAAAVLACGMIFAGAGDADAAKTHTTGAHDTFWKLSKQYSVPLDALLAANPKIDPLNVYAGLKLTIPDAGVKKTAVKKTSTAAKNTTVSTTLKAVSVTTKAASGSVAATAMTAGAAAKTASAGMSVAEVRAANIAAAVPGEAGRKPDVYFKTFDVTASAYTAAPEENGGWGPIDYFGSPLKVGTVAVDPKVIALGTKLYIEGYRYDGLPQGGMYAIARDTGGAIKGKRIDIFVPDSRKQAMKFGIQNVRVYML